MSGINLNTTKENALTKHGTKTEHWIRGKSIVSTIYLSIISLERKTQNSKVVNITTLCVDITYSLNIIFFS